MFQLTPPEPQAGLAADGRDGLAALADFARRISGADVLIAFEAGADGVARPLAASPEIGFTPFNLPGSMRGDTEWAQGPLPAARIHLPSAVLALLERTAVQVWLLPAPVPEAPLSGMLFLWLEGAAAPCDCPFRRNILDQLGLIAPVFAQMLNDRSSLLRKRLALQRFEDLFGSVPNGVVIIEGNGETGLINGQMAELLDATAGEKTVGEISAAMRELRRRCLNADALAALYAPLYRDLDHEVRAVWDLGARKLEVDTHPILGSGRNGRIWLFQDVTTQHIVDENLRRMALTDPLTGLPNRRHFFATADALLAAPALAPVAALMMDIDHFKAINDRYGHPAGDVVLREVAARMQAVLRQQDLLARLGGEEFAVLLGGITSEEVLDLAARLLQAVAAEPVVTPAGLVEARISIGAAQRRGEESLDGLMQRADEALYAAKSAGRNRVVHDLAA